MTRSNMCSEKRATRPCFVSDDFFRSREHIMGVKVRETTAETRMVTLKVTANSRKSRPTMSLINNNGINTATSETVSDMMVKPICAAPFNAASKGAAQIGFTIMSLTVSLVAVLIPLLFMSDIVGRLFREFAVTLSVTILVSAVVSLTLTPMMCSRLLKKSSETKQGRVARFSEHMFDRVIAFYGRTLRWVLDWRAATLVVAVLTLVMTIVLYIIVPK